jgi:hypothetical protein
VGDTAQVSSLIGDLRDLVTYHGEYAAVLSEKFIYINKSLPQTGPAADQAERLRYINRKVPEYII